MSGPEFQVITAHHRPLYVTAGDRQVVLCAAIAGDKESFLAGIEVLHPSTEGRTVCAVIVSKLTYKMSNGQQYSCRRVYGSYWSQDRKLAPRLSV